MVHKLEEKKKKEKVLCSYYDQGLSPQEKAHDVGQVCRELSTKQTYREYFCTSQRKVAAKNNCLTLRGKENMC